MSAINVLTITDPTTTVVTEVVTEGIRTAVKITDPITSYRVAALHDGDRWIAAAHGVQDDVGEMPIAPLYDLGVENGMDLLVGAHDIGASFYSLMLMGLTKDEANLVIGLALAGNLDL